MIEFIRYNASINTFSYRNSSVVKDCHKPIMPPLFLVVTGVIEDDCVAEDLACELLGACGCRGCRALLNVFVGYCLWLLVVCKASEMQWWIDGVIVTR